ncbi:MAG TPA: serine/threonine-protein kinase [bacterium]
MSWLSDNVLNHLRSITELPDLSHTKYRCLEKVASGGMATVYLAEDTELRRPIALKVLTVGDRHGDLAERMMQEARIIAALEHPSIVPIHDVGTLPDGRVFYTMKFVNGRRLDEYVKQTPSLPERLRVFQKICEAVAFAHSRQVIHRDLKPENVMIGDFGEVLVMDWGLAKLLGHDTAEPERKASGELSFEFSNSPHLSAKTTEHGTVMGTPAYMSPEQGRGDIKEVNERSDVYALGAILFFMLTDTPPQPNDSLQPQSRLKPRQINKKVPKQAEAICLKALSPDKNDRYASARQLSEDIERFLNGLAVSSYHESPLEKFGRWISKNKFVVTLVLVYAITRFLIYFLSRL